MTREETKKCIEIMQHFADGGDVANNRNGELLEHPQWVWMDNPNEYKKIHSRVTEEETERITKLAWFKDLDGKIYCSNIDTVPKDLGIKIYNRGHMYWEDWSSENGND